MELTKIKDVEGFSRDENTGAILSTDSQALKAYKLRRKKEREKENLLNDINNLKERMNNIESLLYRLVEEK